MNQNKYNKSTKHLVASSDAPENRRNITIRPRNDDKMHRTARISPSMHIYPANYREDVRAAHAAFAPVGTLAEDSVEEELLRGTLFAEGAVARRVPLTRNDFEIADQRLDVTLALRLETATA